MVPAGIRWLAYLNPLTAPVEMFKSGILPDSTWSWPWMGYSLIVTFAALCGGMWHFARTEDKTMDKL
jgi:ABC-type polysaccharide/polyol phosphate export permease